MYKIGKPYFRHPFKNKPRREKKVSNKNLSDKFPITAVECITMESYRHYLFGTGWKRTNPCHSIFWSWGITMWNNVNTGRPYFLMLFAPTDVCTVFYDCRLWSDIDFCINKGNAEYFIHKYFNISNIWDKLMQNSFL